MEKGSLMTARKVYDVGPSKDGWSVKSGRESLATFAVKTSAVADARRRARTVLRGGGLAQIRVRGRDGRLQCEWTFGKDPRRTPG